MYMIVFYLIAILIITLISGVAVANFNRYRFKGDKTILFTSVFIFLCVLDILLTFIAFVPNP